MNIEEYREFCLSLGDDVEEKMPFTAFPRAGSVLVFYVHGHMFSFFDCDKFEVITEASAREHRRVASRARLRCKALQYVAEILDRRRHSRCSR